MNNNLILSLLLILIFNGKISLSFEQEQPPEPAAKEEPSSSIKDNQNNNNNNNQNDNNNQNNNDEENSELNNLKNFLKNKNNLLLNQPGNGNDDDANEPTFLFDDSTLYKINWFNKQDFLNLNETKLGEEILMVSENQEKYRCILPLIDRQDDYGYSGTGSGGLANKSTTSSSNNNKNNKNDELNPFQLLKPLFLKKSCTYRVENYWTYEICHGKYIRQYHEDPSLKGVVQEFHLGHFDMSDFAKYEKLYDEQREKFEKLPQISVEDRQLPYIEFNMTDGTYCDLSDKKRFTKVLYVCIEDSKHELYSIKETSTCEYEVIVLTPLLCLSPKFKLKTSIENNINCYSMSTSSTSTSSSSSLNDSTTIIPIPKGFELLDIEKELKEPKKRKSKDSSSSSNGISNQFSGAKTIKIDTFSNGKEVHINFITEIEEPESISLWKSHSHIIRKFLDGDYCLTGGSGWWKYEFCYGKSVNQFHEEKGEKKLIINLGKWNLDEHLKWLEKNPTKKPNPNKTPKQVWHYYSLGDICEETQKPRTVEVKLKCNYDAENPDSVAIYLMEPKICDYILGVESPIICDLLSTVNENGIFQFPKDEEL